MANQASKLPIKAPETINNVAKLSDKAGYDRWAFLIKCSLITVDCEDLIDNTINRPPLPAPDDATALLVYERWRKLSRTVMSWLVNQVDSHVIDELRQLPDIPQYTHNMQTNVSRPSKILLSAKDIQSFVPCGNELSG